jgi:hypothetical protein
MKTRTQVDTHNSGLVFQKMISGFGTRKLISSASALVRVLMPFPFAIGSTGLALPPNTRVRIGLTNAANDYRLITDDALPTYQIRLLDMKVCGRAKVSWSKRK